MAHVVWAGNLLSGTQSNWLKKKSATPQFNASRQGPNFCGVNILPVCPIIAHSLP